MVVAVSERIRVSAIAFDLDGTLLDTVADLAAAVNVMLADLGHAPLPKEAIRTMIGKGIDNLVQRALLAARGAARSSRGRRGARSCGIYEDTYDRALGRETVAFPGLREGLERLRERGLPPRDHHEQGDAASRARISSKPASPLFQSGLRRRFDLPAKKPDPRRCSTSPGISASTRTAC